MKNDLILFEDYKVRRLYDEETETWYFSVIDIVQILTQQPEFQAARNYWNVLKSRLKKEGSQSLTNCKRLKLEAADGKKYLTAVANAETVLRLIQSIPSPKAEPIKLWLAKVGYERIQEMTDPEKSFQEGTINERPLTVTEAMKELAEVRAIPVKVKKSYVWVRTDIKGNAASLFKAIGIPFPPRVLKCAEEA